MSLLSFGQSTLGAINGTVEDASGAAIQGAHVTLLNVETNTKHETVTSSTGMYNFRDLMVGAYSVRVEVAGFATQVKQGLQLYGNQAVTADVRMKVSANQTTVEVSAVGNLIDTQNSDIADVITGDEVLTTPFTGRVSDPNVIFLVPGAQNSNGTYNDNGGNGFVYVSGYPPINGARGLDTMVTIDGIAVMANASNEGATVIIPGLEVLQEWHTVTANAPAEFWRPSAETYITKSGQSDYHGSLFEDYGAAFLNAAPAGSHVAAFNVSNKYAASFGGHIIKDKLFFFADFEGSQNRNQYARTASVPIPQYLTGDFSNLAAGSILNPATGKSAGDGHAGYTAATPFASNQVTGISSVSQAIQADYFPAPNQGAVGQLTSNYFKLGPSSSGYANGDFSMTYTPTPKDTLFMHNNYRSDPMTSYTNALPGAQSHYSSTYFAQHGVVSETHQFTPALLNEARIGYVQSRRDTNPLGNGAADLIAAGMKGPFIDYPTPIQVSPIFTISGMTTITGSTNGTEDLKSFDWNDNVSWTKGRHMLKFGVDEDFTHFQSASNSGQIYGNYKFNGYFTGNAYADFLLGMPSSTLLNVPHPVTSTLVQGTMLGAYAQDQFQLNKRLTLNFGVRYEFQGPYSGAPDMMYSFDPKNGDIVVQNAASLLVAQHSDTPAYIPLETAAAAGYPQSSLMFSQKFHLYPRTGFAYRVSPDGGTVLRGAWGLYGDNVQPALATSEMGNNMGIGGGPFAGTSTYTNITTLSIDIMF
jgi:hypothetical protein